MRYALNYHSSRLLLDALARRRYWGSPTFSTTATYEQYDDQHQHHHPALRYLALQQEVIIPWERLSKLPYTLYYLSPPTKKQPTSQRFSLLLPYSVHDPHQLSTFNSIFALLLPLSPPQPLPSLAFYSSPILTSVGNFSGLLPSPLPK